jgi:hypothetical protein
MPWMMASDYFINFNKIKEKGGLNTGVHRTGSRAGGRRARARRLAAPWFCYNVSKNK